MDDTASGAGEASLLSESPLVVGGEPEAEKGLSGTSAEAEEGYVSAPSDEESVLVASSQETIAQGQAFASSREGMLSREEAPVDDQPVSILSTDDIVPDTVAGTCIWNIDARGNLSIRPEAGSEGSLPSTEDAGDVPWKDSVSQITSITINNGTVKTGEFAVALFAGCVNLESVDLSGLDTSETSDMTEMFDSCGSLLTIDLSGFDTSNVTDMSYMFYACTNLASVNVSSFETENLLNTAGMFYECLSLVNLDLSSFYTPQLDFVGAMFYGCESLISLDISQLNTYFVSQSEYENLFFNCSNLAVVKVSESYDLGFLSEHGSTDSGGRAFTGKWVADSDAAVYEYDGVPVNKADTYRAQAEYVLSFDTVGGSGAPSAQVLYNGAVTGVVAEPTRAYYTFGGWWIESNGAGVLWTLGTVRMTTEDTVLYAKWVANNYAVSFESNGGSAVSNRSVAYETKVTQPPDPVRSGYTFAGWFKEATLNTPWNFDTDTMPASSITLYAKWAANNYTVSFESNGGSAVSSEEVAFETKVTQPADPVRANFIFGGWFQDDTLTTPWHFELDTVPANDITLYAKWVPDGTTQTHTVSFEFHNGSEPLKQRVAFEAKINKPVDPVREGYTFDGWFKDETLTLPMDFDVDTMPAHDITLHAKWEAMSPDPPTPPAPPTPPVPPGGQSDNATYFGSFLPATGDSFVGISLIALILVSGVLVFVVALRRKAGALHDSKTEK